MFANIGDLTSNVISSEKNLPLPILVSHFHLLYPSNLKSSLERLRESSIQHYDLSYLCQQRSVSDFN